MLRVCGNSSGKELCIRIDPQATWDNVLDEKFSDMEGQLLFNGNPATIDFGDNLVAYIARRYNMTAKGLQAIAPHIPLAKIIACATRVDWSFQPDMLEAGVTRTISFTSHNAAWLLANSFLGNLRSDKLYWGMLFTGTSRLAHERLKCICDYFTQFDPAQPARVIEILRISGNPTVLVDDVLTTDHVILHTGTMESKPGAFVDFANMDLHIHKIIASATQEEVLFSMCSECLVALMITPTLRDDEVIIFRNVWRHSTYTGYDMTFTFAGPNPTPNEVIDIIAIDATVYEQFSLVERDIKKAVLGFGNVRSETISTGKWGCGAFGGDVYLKFIQQMIAAQLTKKTLYYSDEEAERYWKVIKLIDERKPTIRWMINCIRGFPYYSGFIKYLCKIK